MLALDPYQQMSLGAQIDYAAYSRFMRTALSGSQICNEDGSLNHAYFNTKKGFYWSQKNTDALTNGIVKHGLDLTRLQQDVFKNQKTEIQLQLRVCLLMGAKEFKSITEADLAAFRKKHGKK